MIRKILLAAALVLASAAARGQALIPYYLYLQPFSGGTAVALSGYGTIQDEGVDLTLRSKLNCVGAGVTCADSGAVTTLTVPGAAATGYQTVQDEGSALTQYTVLNCVGAGIVCSNGASKTTITVGGAAGGVTLQGSYPGTPDTGNANITGTYGSTQNAIHNTSSMFGLSLENNQAALVGQTREYSPGIRFLGAAWDTDGAISNTNAWQLYGRPISGVTTSVDLVWASSLSGGAYATKMYLSSGGDLTLGEAGVSAGTISFNNATSGQIVLTPPAGAMGSRTLTFPLATDTFAVLAATQTLSSKTLTTPNIDNGATSAGYARYLENSGNGTNYIQLNGQDSLAANYGVRLPANVPDTTTTPSLGYESGEDQIYLHEDFICGSQSATGMVGQCFQWAFQISGGAWSAPATGSTTNPGYAVCTLDATNDACGTTSTQTQVLLMDGFRWRTRLKMDQLSNDTESYIVYAGGNDMAANSAAAPTNGVFFSYTNNTANATPNWMINSFDTGTDTGPLSCGIAATTNWVKLDIRYDTGTGTHFYVDGVECPTNSPINTDLPQTASSEDFRWSSIKFVKLLHTATAGTFDIDYVTLGPTAIAR